MRKIILVLLLVLNVYAVQPEWKEWRAEVFQEAKKENKIIIMDLEAVWCHWCHVMDKTTYKDEKVVSLLDKYYISVKVDHDRRPDLAQRYREYGWPATIFFLPDGTEIVKRSGYINPESMARLLQAIVDDPSAEDLAVEKKLDFSKTSQLSKTVQKELVNRHEKFRDLPLGGLKTTQKFLDKDSVEWAFLNLDNKIEKAHLIQTLDASIKLVDPVWGGVYQYSTHGDWEHPHYEKIILVQADYARIYAMAAKLLNDPKYLTQATKIVDYMFEFLRSKEGGFYVSQDADLEQGKKAHSYFKLSDKKRRALGIPKVDKHIYSSSNGTVIEALVQVYESGADKKYLDSAIRSAEWTLKHRSLGKGGFSHDKTDAAGPYLNDTLMMGRAFLSLYRVTGEAKWLKLSALSGSFINDNFKDKEAGLLSAVPNDSPILPLPQLDENILAARYLNLLAFYTGKKEHREVADYTMKYLSTKEIALSRVTEAGILTLNEEFIHEPAHYTVVNTSINKKVKALQKVALEDSTWFTRIDFYNPNKEAFNDDVGYPEEDTAAGYVCSEGRCSLGAFSPQAYGELIEAFK